MSNADAVALMAKGYRRARFWIYVSVGCILILGLLFGIDLYGGTYPGWALVFRGFIIIFHFYLIHMNLGIMKKAKHHFNDWMATSAEEKSRIAAGMAPSRIQDFRKNR